MSRQVVNSIYAILSVIQRSLGDSCTRSRCVGESVTLGHVISANSATYNWV